jgi:hypothetical protein
MTPENFVIYVQAILDAEHEKGREFQLKNGLLLNETTDIELIGPLGLIEKALHQVHASAKAPRLNRTQREL